MRSAIASRIAARRIATDPETAARGWAQLHLQLSMLSKEVAARAAALQAAADRAYAMYKTVGKGTPGFANLDEVKIRAAHHAIEDILEQLGKHRATTSLETVVSQLYGPLVRADESAHNIKL